MSRTGLKVNVTFLKPRPEEAVRVLLNGKRTNYFVRTVDVDGDLKYETVDTRGNVLAVFGTADETRLGIGRMARAYFRDNLALPYGD